MKSIIDRIFSARTLALLLALCATSGAWAATKPLAVWNGDFGTTTRNGFTLSAQNNTIAADGSKITITDQGTGGVLVSTTVNNYKSLTCIAGFKTNACSLADAPFLMATQVNRNDGQDLTGIFLDSTGKFQGSWKKGNGQGSKNIYYPEDEGIHYFADVFRQSTSYGTKAYLDGSTLVVEDTTLASSSGNTTGMSIGGAKAARKLVGAEINYIAVFASTNDTHPTDFEDYVRIFSPTTMTSAANPANGDTLSASDNATLVSQGINLPTDGYITIDGDVTVAALFAQANATLGFSGSGSLTIGDGTGPLYVASGATLTIDLDGVTAPTAENPFKLLVKGKVFGATQINFTNVPANVITSVGEGGTVALLHNSVYTDLCSKWNANEQDVVACRSSGAQSSLENISASKIDTSTGDYGATATLSTLTGKFADNNIGAVLCFDEPEYVASIVSHSDYTTLGGLFVTVGGSSLSKASKQLKLGHKAWADGSNRKTTWYVLTQSFDMSGFSTTGNNPVYGEVNMVIYDGATLTLPSPSGIELSTDKNPGATLKMSGGGSLSGKVGTKSDAKVTTLDYSALAPNRVSAFIQGELGITQYSKFKFPSGVDATYPVATSVTGASAIDYTFVIGSNEYLAPLTFSDGNALFPAVATLNANTTWAAIPWDAKPATIDSTTVATLNITGNTTLDIAAAATVKKLVLNISDGVTLTLANAGNHTTVDGIVIRGTGTLKIDGAVTFAALTVEDNATIEYNSSATALTVTGALTVNSGKTLTLAPAALTSVSSATLLTVDSMSGTVAVTTPEDAGNTYDVVKDATAVTLKRTPIPAFSYDAVPGGAPSGWGITSWCDSTYPEYFRSKLRVGPNSTFAQVYEATSGEYPWQNLGAKSSAFTFAVYVDVSKVSTTEKRVIASFGNKYGGDSVMLYREGDYIKAAFVTSNGSLNGSAATVTAENGYHLYTVVCNPSGETPTLTLYKDGEAGVAASPTTTVSLGAGIGLGTSYNGAVSGFNNGENLAFAAIVGYDTQLTTGEIANLSSVKFPKTTGGTFSHKVINTTADTTLTVYSSTTTSADARLGVTFGTTTIPAGETVNVVNVRTSDAGTGTTGTLNINGTLNVSAESTNKDVAGSGGNTGVVIGWWGGSTKVNVPTGGVLNAPNAYLEIPYSNAATTETLDINGGTVKVKGIYANKASVSTVELRSGGVLEVGEIVDTKAFTLNLRYGTLRINSDATLSSATFGAASGNATTIDPHGNNITVSNGALNGSGDITVADSAGGGTVTFVGGSSYSGRIILTDANSARIDISDFTGTVECQGTTAATLEKLNGFAGTVYFTESVDASAINLSGATVNVAADCTYTAIAGQEGTMVLASGATATLKVTDDIFNYEGYVPVVSGSGSVGYYKTSASAAIVNTETETYTIGNNLLPYYYVWETTEGSSAGIASGETSGWGRMDGGTRPVNGKNVAFHVQGETTVNVDEANVSYATVQAYGSGTLKFSGANALTVATQFVVEDGVTLEYDATKLTVSSIEVDDGAELAVVGGTEVAPIAITADIAGEGTLRIASGVVSLDHVNRNFTGDIYIMPGARAVSTVVTDNTATGFGRQGTTITVYVGGQLDVAGTSGVSHNLVIDTDPAGGEGDYEAAIVNTGNNIGNTERQACSLTVNTSATIDCSHTWGILASSHGATTLTLAKGVTLTKTGTGTFLIASATVSNTGSGVTNPGIDIAEGTVEIVSQGSSTACTLATGATLDVVVENGATLNVYKGFAASNLVVSGNGTVNVSSSGSLTLSAAYGAGTVNWTGKSPDGDVWKTSAGWTGTNVVISATGLTDMNPANWGNASSFIKLNGVAGHFVKGNVEATAKKTILEDNGANAALQISNGYQGSSVTFRKIVGDGTIADTHNHTTAWHMLVFKDATEFTGSIKATQASGCKKFVFSDAGTGTASASGSEGRLVVQSDGHAVIGAGKEWKPAYSIHIAGEVKLLGAATMSKPVTINGTTAKLLLADSALTINNTLTFADGAALTIDPGAIDLTTKTSLMTGLTEEPNVSGITVPGCTVSVGGTSGAYTIDAVYKEDTSWRGESATWSESSFNGKEIDTADQDVAFILGASGAVTVTLDGTRTPANVVFNGGSTTTYTLTGGAFSPSGTVTVESGSVTIESAATGMYVVRDGATLSLTDATVTSVSGAGTLNIPAGGVVTLASVTAIDGIDSLTGRGKLVMPSAGVPETALQTLLQKGADWQGTILIHNKTGWTNINPNLYGNTASKVELQGIDGYFVSPSSVRTITPEIIFNNGSYNYAYKHSTDAYSYDNNHPGNYTVFRKVSGTGSLNSSLGNAKHPVFVFVDATGFSGSILHSSGGESAIYLFTDSETLPNASAYDSTLVNGTINVWAAGTAVIGDGNMWRSGSQGMKVQGTLQIEGAATLAFAYNAITFKNGTTVRFMNPASDKCLTIASDTAGTLKALTVAAGDTVNIAFGDGVTPVAGTKLISWGGAPEGSFVAEDCTLVKKSDGLYVSGGVDDGTAVVEDTEGVVTIPSDATAVELAITGGSASLVSTTSLAVNGEGKNVTVYATDANGQKTSTDITSAFKVTAGENNTYTVELDDTKVTPEVTGSTPMAFTSTAPTFAIEAVPGLWYAVEVADTIAGLDNPSYGTPVQAESATVNPVAPEFTGTVKYYRIGVAPSKAALVVTPQAQE